MNNELSTPKKDTKPASKADAKSNQELSPPKKGHRKSPSDPGNTRESSEEGNKLGKGMLSKTPTIKEPRKEDQTRNLGWKSPTPSNRSSLTAKGGASESAIRSQSTKDAVIGANEAKAGKDPTTKKAPMDKEPAKESARTRKTSLPDSKSQRLAPDIPWKLRVSNPDSLKRLYLLKRGRLGREAPRYQHWCNNPNRVRRPKSTSCTDLNQEGETFRLGYGIDALTRDPTTCCTLAPFRMHDSHRRIKSTSTTINVLHWDDLKQLADGIELEAGVGTVNAASFQLPVEMKQKLSSMLSTSTSVKTLLVQYKVVREFEVEFLPRYIAY
uniref:Uncharacterized protein n=1 Tax=Moniliophthora roreri TaxID=221103 RepID=A0A0W0G5P4_MONRR